MAQENLSTHFAFIGMLGAAWGVIYNHIELLLGGFFLLLIACIIMIVKWLKPKRSNIKILNYKRMIDEIFKQFNLMRDVLKAYNENGKKKEDIPTIVESMKVINKELAEVLEGKKEEGSE